MDIKALIEENAEALRGFKGQIADLGDDVVTLKDRLKHVEQHGASHRPRLGADGSDLAKRIREHESFTAFMGGNAKHAKMSFDVPLLRKNTITGDSGSPAQPDGTLVQAERLSGIVGGAFRQPRIRDVMRVLPTSSNLVEYTKEQSWTNNAAPQQGEGETKAESDLTFALEEMPVRTLAHFIKASRQALDDAPALEAFVDERMRHGVQMAEEDQILNGDGTGHNLTGLITEATSYNKSVTGDTYLDTLRRAIQQVAESDWAPNAIILHTREWSELELLKDNEGRYLFGQPGTARPLVVWGLPVVPTNSMNAGEFIVADLMNSAILWDRQSATVEAFEEDDDNVQRNLVTIRAEERVALTVIRPAAIVHGSF